MFKENNNTLNWYSYLWFPRVASQVSKQKSSSLQNLLRDSLIYPLLQIALPTTYHHHISYTKALPESAWLHQLSKKDVMVRKKHNSYR